MTGRYEPVVGSLCTGYGGLELALALAFGVPIRHAWHVENDGIAKAGKRKGELTGPRLLLAQRFPNVPNYGDLKTLDYALMERVDILTAGYPCQPFSNAGLRLGEADERHLWPYVADTIGALRPRLVVLENVEGHVRRGLSTVVADLAGLGYDARWGLVRASEAGAPHQRKRVFIVAQDADSAARGERWLAAPGQAQGGWAWADAGGRGGAPAADAGGERHGGGQDGRSLGRLDGAHEGVAQERERAWQEPVDRGAEAPADADSDGLALVGGLDSCERDADGRDGQDADGDRREPAAWGPYEPAIRRWERISGRRAPWATEPRGRGGAERLSPRFVEWMMGLPDGWVTAVEGLTVNEQLKLLGNGVVPQQAALAVRQLLAAVEGRVAA